MNLHSIASPIVGAVNTNVTIQLMQNAGYTTNPDFSRSPAYVTTEMTAQIQGLQSDDIRILNGLGIQGERRKVYLWGTWSGLVRSLQKGSDLMVFPDGSLWKVQYVFEDFGHGVSGPLGWCSVAAVLQNPTSEDYVVPPMPPPPPFPPLPPPFIDLDDPATYGSLLSTVGPGSLILANGSRVGQTLTITDVAGLSGSSASNVGGTFNTGSSVLFDQNFQSFVLYWSGTEWVVISTAPMGGSGGASLLPVPIDTRTAPQTYTLPLSGDPEEAIVVFDTYGNAQANPITIVGSSVPTPVINQNYGSIPFLWTGIAWVPF